MNEDRFNELVEKTRLSEKTRELAKRIFVEGLSQPEAVIVSGLTKQRVNSIVDTIRKLEQEDQALALGSKHADPVAVIEASYAFAVKAARDQYGADVNIKRAPENFKLTGPIIFNTDFHTVQFLGRDSVVVHELAKLDRVPGVGKSVSIEYRGGIGQVTERGKGPQERSR